MDCNTNLRKSYYPRGMAIVTGEMVPSMAESRNARLFLVELKKGDISFDLLNELEPQKETLNILMKKYIEWLSKDLKTTSSELKIHFILIRESLLDIEEHARIGENISFLYIGYKCFLDFLISSSAISQEEANQKLSQALEILKNVAIDQNKIVKDSKPSEQFILALKELLSNKQCYLLPLPLINSNCPNSMSSKLVGYEDDTNYWLLPDTIFTEIRLFYNKQDVSFSLSKTALWKYLDKENIIGIKEETRYTSRKLIYDKQERVLNIPKSILDLY